MGKMRVYELANELKVESRDVLDVLSSTPYAVKQASNGLGEEAIELVRKKFNSLTIGKPVSVLPTARAKKEAPKKETVAKAGAKKEPVKESSRKETAAKREEKDKGADSKSVREGGQKEPTAKGDASKSVREGGQKEPASKGEALKPVKEDGQKEQKSKDGAQKPKTSKAGNPKEQGAKKDVREKDSEHGEAKDRPKKKASISALFNPQYSKSAKQKSAGGKNNGGGNGSGKNNGGGSGAGKKSGSGNGNGSGSGTGNRNKNRRTGNGGGNARPESHSIIKPRPIGERTMRPISERTANNKDDFSDIRKKVERKEAERAERAERSAERKRRSAEEQQKKTEKAVRPEGNAGEKVNISDKNAADKNNRNAAVNRDQQKTNRGDKSGRSQERNNGQKNNNGGGNGNNNARGGNNGNAGGKKRFDRDNDKNRKNNGTAASTAPAEASRGKDNRKKKNSGRNDRDKLGSKRQENYVNLEKKTGRKKPQNQPQPKEDENVIKTIMLPDKMTIRELADKMKLQPSAVVKKLFLKGQMVTVNQEVDFDTAEEIALEFNFICEQEEKIDVIAELLKEEEEDVKNMVSRPPVVCVMGHVDHGKTSLLDAIRSTRVTDREAGGITQHIGASVVAINGQTITFLDTPGHEAFTAMRMRGANSTDIAILVVAADDGVMPQTIEAINHAKAAGVEIIVAINKIDKPGTNIEKVKQELSEYELIPEDWGGSTIFCPVSAHTGEGIDNLLEMILLTAEVLELKANPKRNARGLVIEAQLDKGRGAVATVLVQKGTLHVGDPIGCGSSYGKVRAMIDDKGRRVKAAGPSTPVEILGLNSVPDAGETFVVQESEKDAKAFADTFIAEEKNKLIEDTKAKMSLDDLFSQIQSGNMKELDIIVKADVQGSVEAVKQSLVKLSNEEVVVKVIHGGVGAINESDVILASASNAIIIGFNVRPDPMAKSTAEREGVDIRLYKVIYNAIEDVEAAMKGMLDPVFEEKVIGHAEIRQIFKASGIGNIAGSYVLDGIIERGCKVRISREGEQIFEGELASLKRFKDDVKEVRSGFECGLVFDGFGEIRELDQVEAYKMVEVPR